MEKKKIDIVSEVKKSFQNNRQRLIDFFQHHGYGEQQAEELSESMKVAVFFLETHAYDRHDLDIEMRKEIKADLKIEIESLKNAKPTIEQLVPQLDWDEIFKVRYEQLEEHKFNQTRAGKNKSLEMALEPLFWRLETFDIGQTEQVNIVYDLFVEFELDDYGEEYSTQDTLIGEKEQKERIRIHFQQKAIKVRKKYAKQFGW